MKPQHGTNPRARRYRRDRHQALERAEKQAAQRARKYAAGGPIEPGAPALLLEGELVIAPTGPLA